MYVLHFVLVYILLLWSLGLFYKVVIKKTEFFATIYLISE